MVAHGVPDDRQPAFLVTVDVECDDAWSGSRTVTTKNALYLPRFQAHCEQYGVRPTYLTTWEMAASPAFREFGRDLLARRAGEIGMHLHAWPSPPDTPLTDDDYRHRPYLIEYPESVLREKVKVLTDTLEDVFATKMLSHRAGRFGFDSTYARALIHHGYRVDCSVTPGVSWRDHPGRPGGPGGPDYTEFPDEAYFVDPTDIRRPGASPLLEVPVTIGPPYLSRPARLARAALAVTPLGAKVANRLFPRCAWLYPGKFHRAMPGLLRSAAGAGRDYAEFMIHSSELMPGGSPRYPTAASIEALYRCLDRLFAAARRKFVGSTLSEYHDRFVAARQADRPTTARSALARRGLPEMATL